MNIGKDAAIIAVEYANDDTHGYDQQHRWSPDFDCSSLVITIYKLLGVNLSSTYTGNMKADFLKNGFSDVTGIVNLKTSKGMLEGDVLLNEKHHAAIFVGNGKMVAARINEKGTTTGGQTGDQTGTEICVQNYTNYPWDCVLRINETIDIEDEELINFPWVQMGSIGVAVYAVQAALQYLGYLRKSDLDGIAGTITVSAICRFQKNNQLEEDGIAGNKTLYKLFHKGVY